MKDKTMKILLGIIAVNLTIQTVKDVDVFPLPMPRVVFRRWQFVMNRAYRVQE